MGELPETEVFEDPVLDEPVIDIDPEVSDAGPFPESETDVEPSLSSEGEPPVQDAAPIPPVGPHPLPAEQPAYAPPAYQPPPAYTPPAQPEAPFYTRQQLQNAVDQGTISEDQMVSQLQLQEREQIKRETLAAIQAEQREQHLLSQVNQYHSLTPGWNQPGTPAFNRANAEYQRLLQRGFQANNLTTLTALEAAFGTPDRIQASRQSADMTRNGRPTAPAITRRGNAPAPVKSVDPLKNLPKDQLQSYQHLIRSGLYADWNAVREEVKFSLKQTVNQGLKHNTERLMRR